MGGKEPVRKEISNLLLHYFGDGVTLAYNNGYSNETLPIYIHGAGQLLEKQVGKEKSKAEINQVLSKYSIKTIRYG